MDPFHVVRLAGDALDRCRRRIQLIIHGHPATPTTRLPGLPDPAHRRRPPHRQTAATAPRRCSPTTRTSKFKRTGHYQRMITAYREPDRARGRQLMAKVIDALHHGVPKPLTELLTLGRTLMKRAVDVLAYFDRAAASTGPTEAIQRQARTPPRLRPRCRNLTNYLARCLLEAGGFRPRLHAHSQEPDNSPSSPFTRHRPRRSTRLHRLPQRKSGGCPLTEVGGSLDLGMRVRAGCSPGNGWAGLRLRRTEPVQL